MEEGSRLKGTDRHPRLTTAVVSPLLLFLCADIVAETSVNRCVTPDGKIEFRQFACAADAEEEEVLIEDRKTGWEPAKTKLEKTKTRSDKSSTHNRKSDEKKLAAKAKQEEQCWKKHQMLEEVNWKLRRGYKPATGVKLRRKRRQYEEYIGRFCDGQGP